MKKALTILFIAIATLAWSEAEVRVVSLAPQLTEIIYAIGGESMLVGRTTACDYPSEVKEIPIVGNFAEPFLERLLEVKPTLVVANVIVDQNKVNFLKKAKIEYIQLENSSLNDYLKSVETLGHLLNRNEEAKKEVERVNSFVAKQKAVKYDKKPRVLYLLNDKPLMTAGKKSFVNEIITLAGGENVAAVEDKDYFVCSLEWVISQKVDILIAPKMLFSNLEDMRKRQGWLAIPAVKNGNVISNFNQDLILRLGPRSTDGVKFLQEKFRR